jgi:hypothetical protein
MAQRQAGGLSAIGLGISLMGQLSVSALITTCRGCGHPPSKFFKMPKLTTGLSHMASYLKQMPQERNQMARNGIHLPFVVVLLIKIAILCGCGGSSSAPPPAPSFSIAAAPAQVTILPNSTAQINLTVTTSNGFTGTVNVTLSGLPSGVTAVPASPFTLPSSGVAVTLAADPSVGSGSYNLTFNATGGGLTSGAPVSLMVATASTTGLRNRTDFIATSDTPSSITYDPAHNTIYAYLPHIGQLNIINAATHRLLDAILLPMGSVVASGLSLTPDGKRLLVGGATQQLAWIDTATQKLSQFQILPPFQNPCCPPALAEPGLPMVMASGKVLFVSGYSPLRSGIMEWDLVGGQLIQINPNPNTSIYFAQGTIGARSADGTKAIFSTNTLPSSIAIFDATADTFVAASQTSNFAFALAANPSGTQFAVAVNLVGISILDNQLKVIGQAPVGGPLYGMTYSPDGKKLYIVSIPANVPLISTVDTTTFQVTGQAPAYATSIAYIQRVPPLFVENPMAADGTGLLFGASDHGVAIDDSTYFKNISPNAAPPVSAIVNPAEGSQTSATSVSIATQVFNSAPSVWFGGLAGVNSSLNSTGQVQVLAPPAPSVGPVNVKALSADGTEANIPNGFTYGLVPLTGPALAAPSSGGVSLDLFGYGFGSDVGSSVQVQMGSASASIVKSVLFPTEYTYGYPFPLDHVRSTVPAGSFGVADITITSSAGTGKIPNGLHFVHVNDYPSPDTLKFVLYDPHRSQLYLSAGNHIDVFSLASHTFLTPITPPTLSGTALMLGLALTPDGSSLLAANYADNSIAIINPDNPSTAKAVQVVPPGSITGTLGPTQLVVSNLNHALVAVSSSSAMGVGGGPMFDMDLSTLVIKTLVGPFDSSISAQFLSSSRDGSKLFLGLAGQGVFVLDTATNTWSAGPPRSPFEVAASGDGNVFASDTNAPPPLVSATSVSFFDGSANMLAVTGLPEYLAATPALEGIKLNDAGSLAYVGDFLNIPVAGPTVNQDFVDIFDVRHGDLRERVYLSEQFLPEEQAQNGLAIDRTGQNIFLLTSTGLTIVTLDNVPLSIGSLSPTSGASGSTISIRGSGFTQQTTATCNGSNATVTFVDADTLQLALPGSLAKGPVSITLANPDGSTYNLDAVFNVN